MDGLLDFSKPLDIGFFDKVVETLHTATDQAQVCSNEPDHHFFDWIGKCLAFYIRLHGDTIASILLLYHSYYRPIFHSHDSSPLFREMRPIVFLLPFVSTPNHGIMLQAFCLIVKGLSPNF